MKQNNSPNQTFNASDSVTVDTSTVEFLEATEKWAEEEKENQEKIREATLEQALFVQGFQDYQAQVRNVPMLESSDAYFQGFEYGRQVQKNLKKEAERRFPLPMDMSRRRLVTEHTLKRQLEEKEI